MLQELKTSGRLPLTLMLIGMALFCCTLSLFRLYVTGTGYYLFLNWNLFLAGLPWAATTLVVLRPSIRANKVVLGGLLALWLLFFPNSPYILTDLFHLRGNNGGAIWYDLLLILCFAWCGLAFGLISLRDIERILLEKFSRWAVYPLITGLLFLSGFGVYLGRYGRWNSWDLFQDPFPLLHDIVIRITDPMAHTRTWGLTILMGILLNMIYWTIKLLHHPSPLARPATASAG